MMHLTTDEKRAILEQRVKQFAAEKYQHEVNYDVAQALENAEGMEAALQAIATLTAAISIHEEKLAALES